MFSQPGLYALREKTKLILKGQGTLPRGHTHAAGPWPGSESPLTKRTRRPQKSAPFKARRPKVILEFSKRTRQHFKASELPTAVSPVEADEM